MNMHVRALLTFAGGLIFGTIPGIAQFIPAPGSPFAVNTISGFVAGDFNDDGHQDVAAMNTAGPSVSVLLANGRGRFRNAPETPFAIGSGSTLGTVADFDRDGKLDLVLINSSDKSVTVLLGNGRGGFGAAIRTPVPDGIWLGAVAAADFDGDGKPDLAIANNSSNNFANASTSPNGVVVMLGDGTGGFHAAPGSPFVVGTLYVTALATGDFNRDGKQDLAVGFLHNQTPMVLIGKGTGGFSVPENPVAEPILCGITSIAVADFNGDGRLDAAVACNAHVGSLTVLLGNGSGGFSSTSYGMLGEPHSVSVADFNGDGIPDLAVLQTGPEVTVLFGTGTGGFKEAPGSPYAAGLPIGPANGGLAAVGDFDRDDKPDIVAWNPQGGSLSVLLNSLPAIAANPPSITFHSQAGARTAVQVRVDSALPGSTYNVTSSQPWVSVNPTANATGGPSAVTISVDRGTLPPGTYFGVVRYLAPNFFGAKTEVEIVVPEK